MGITERIQEIEKEMARTQKNKATSYHLGLLKGKLAKLRSELLEPPAEKGGPKQAGFEVQKSGPRAVLIGFPSSGKSTLLNTITNTVSEAANYEFTTLVSVPGVLNINGAAIQLLDLPGIIQGAAQGVGRGRQVIATAKTADLVIMILDATKSDLQRQLLTTELEAVGIRLNQRKPDIYLKPKNAGGLTINMMVKQSQLDEKLIQGLLKEYKIFNAEVLVREDVTVEQFVDVILNNRKYVNCLYCYTKVDAISVEELDRIARQPHSVAISSEFDLGLQWLIQEVWNNLNLVRVYTKRKGERPDLDNCIVIRKSKATVEAVCNAIHRNLKNDFTYAMVWGRSARHQPQRVGLSHVLKDEDVVQIFKKK